VSSGFCATTTGAMAIHSPKCGSTSPGCWARAAPDGGRRCPPSKESLIRYREDADPVLDSTEPDGTLAWPRIQAYVKQLSTGPKWPGPSGLGCRCKRRRRNSRTLTVV
jgi:hypothetical protein